MSGPIGPYAIFFRKTLVRFKRTFDGRADTVDPQVTALHYSMLIVDKTEIIFGGKIGI